MTSLYLNVIPDGVTLGESANPNALASVNLITNYAFDDNVVVKVHVIDDKTRPSDDDPLNNLIFNIVFKDKVDDSKISTLNGRLFTGGGTEALEAAYPNDFAYITRKLDFYGAMDSEQDFFEEVITSYNPEDSEAIETALAGITNSLSSFRINSETLPVPETLVTPVTSDNLKRAIYDMNPNPRYMVTAETSDLTYIEALAEVMSKRNNHLIVDVGELSDWNFVTAITEAFSINDHRFSVYWNPTKSRASNATTVLARKKWRPCIGDLLGQILLRNAQTNAAGIPPIHKPVAGHDYPVAFRDPELLDGVVLDEEAQNALAEAGVNFVVNERFTSGDRWIFGDVLTQYDSKTSALRLMNSSEITTYTDNLSISIVKKHLLKGMSSFIKDSNADLRRALDACAVSGMFTPATELNGKYYAVSVLPRTDNPFEKADLKLARRPQGCARQVFFETTVTK